MPENCYLQITDFASSQLIN